MLWEAQAGEEEKESARGTMERGKREERLQPFPSSHRPPRAFYFSDYRVLKCDVIKMKFLKLWNLSGYSERTISKRPTCQK